MITLLPLSLVLGSAFIHASWHLLMKQSANRVAFLTFSTMASVVIFSPIVYWLEGFQMVPALWPVLLVSGVAEVLYMIALTNAYEKGDLSLVYPLARGSAPFFVFLWSGFILGERLPFWGYVGVTLILLGIYLTTLSSLNDWLKPIKSLQNSSSRWALLSGFFIAVYTLADREGVHLISAWSYNLYTFVMMSIGGGIYLALTSHRRTAQQEWRRNWLQVIGTGAVNIVSYLIILYALSIIPASYVTAVRGTSIVLSAFYGWRIRREQLGNSRPLGAGCIVMGLATLALGG